MGQLTVDRIDHLLAEFVSIRIPIFVIVAAVFERGVFLSRFEILAILN